jgi:hypothetical protein
MTAFLGVYTPYFEESRIRFSIHLLADPIEDPLVVFVLQSPVPQMPRQPNVEILHLRSTTSGTTIALQKPCVKRTRAGSEAYDAERVVGGE